MSSCVKYIVALGSVRRLAMTARSSTSVFLALAVLLLAGCAIPVTRTAYLIGVPVQTTTQEQRTIEIIRQVSLHLGYVEDARVAHTAEWVRQHGQRRFNRLLALFRCHRSENSILAIRVEIAEDGRILTVSVGDNGGAATAVALAERERLYSRFVSGGQLSGVALRQTKFRDTVEIIPYAP